MELSFPLPTLPILQLLGSRTFLVDPETYRESETTHTSTEAEWISRVALALPEPIDGGSVAAADLDEFTKAVTELFALLAMHNASASVSNDSNDMNGRATERIVAQSRTHLTAVRFAEFQSQREQIDADLLRPFDEDIERIAGFNAYEAITALRALAALSAARAHERVLQVSREVTAEGANAQDGVQAILLDHFMAAPQDSIFSVNDLRGVVRNPAAFLNFFSLSFGLTPAPRVGPVEEILNRPLIALADGTYFGHMLPLIHYALRNRFEGVLRSNPDLWIRYERHRSSYLEDRTTDLLKTALPEAQFEQNVTYPGGEVDVIGVMDRMLFVVECKAGGLQFPQRQGARLRRALKALLTDAHEQLLRAQTALQSGAQLRRDDGAMVKLSYQDVDRVYLIHATLDSTSAFTTNTAQAIAAGLYRGGQQPWSVSLPDLELIADIVDCNSHLPHYLDRRALATASGRIQTWEEMGWFMNYAEQGLFFEEDLKRVDAITLFSFTGALDNYYMYRDGIRKTPAPKPEVRMQPKYRALLRQLEASGVAGWSMGGNLLMEPDGKTRAMILKRLRSIRRKSAPSAATFSYGDRVLVLFGGPLAFRQLRQAATRYGEARIARLGAQCGLVVAVSQLLPDAKPEFAYIDFARQDPPPEDEVARRLSIYSQRAIAPL